MAAGALFALGPAIGWASAASSFLAKREAVDRERQALAESIRRTHLEHQKTLGEGTAAGAASGIEFDSSSLQTYLGRMRDEFAKQEAWQLAAGNAQADADREAAGWGLFGDLGGSLFSSGQNMGWGRTGSGGSR